MKPLRQEDYQATAEENRCLKAEVEALKAEVEVLKPKPKAEPPKPSRMGLWIALSLVGVLAITGFRVLHRMAKQDAEHNQAAPECYKVAQPRIWNDDTHEWRDSLPWESWSLWARRTVHYTDLRRVPGTLFKSKQEGLDFARSWGLKVCE